MSEVKDGSVDLIITSPPYNIGTKYGNYSDSLPIDEYKTLLKKVFSECTRILKPGGKLILECADSALINGTYIQLAGHIQGICIKLGLKVIERHINFSHSDNGSEIPEHGWKDDYTTTANSHSNCHQIIVFSRSDKVRFVSSGEVLYMNYKSVEGHPCPTPEAIYTFLLDKYFSSGMTVMDVFMGTAVLGAEVIKRGGLFIGYERDAFIYEIAERNLNRAIK